MIRCIKRYTIELNDFVLDQLKKVKIDFSKPWIIFKIKFHIFKQQ